MILSLGIVVALASWISAAALLAVVALTYAYRVRVEARALLSAIGDPYRRYMARTTRFVPFLF